MHLDRTTRRILGSLVEKRLSTPEQYPLTLNAVVLACNQKSNREPAMELPEFLVEGCLKQLRVNGWVSIVERDFGRSTRYAERLTEQLGLSPREAAILAELLLRGPQTEQELHRRCERMVKMASPEEVVGILQMMASRRLVQHIAREVGQRIARWKHLLTPPDEEGAPQEPGSAGAPAAWGTPAPPRPATAAAAAPAASARSAEPDPVSNPYMPACAGSSSPGLLGWAGPDGDRYAHAPVPRPAEPEPRAAAEEPAAPGGAAGATSAQPARPAYGSFSPAAAPRAAGAYGSAASGAPGGASSYGAPATAEPVTPPAAVPPSAATIAAARAHYGGGSSPAPSLAIPDDAAALRTEVIALRAEVARLRARIAELTRGSLDG